MCINGNENHLFCILIHLLFQQNNISGQNSTMSSPLSEEAWTLSEKNHHNLYKSDFPTPGRNDHQIYPLFTPQQQIMGLTLPSPNQFDKSEPHQVTESTIYSPTHSVNNKQGRDIDSTLSNSKYRVHNRQHIDYPDHSSKHRVSNQQHQIIDSPEHSLKHRVRKQHHQVIDSAEHSPKYRVSNHHHQVIHSAEHSPKYRVSDHHHQVIDSSEHSPKHSNINRQHHVIESPQHIPKYTSSVKTRQHDVIKRPEHTNSIRNRQHKVREFPLYNPQHSCINKPRQGGTKSPMHTSRYSDRNSKHMAVVSTEHSPKHGHRKRYRQVKGSTEYMSKHSFDYRHRPLKRTTSFDRSLHTHSDPVQTPVHHYWSAKSMDRSRKPRPFSSFIDSKSRQPRRRLPATPTKPSKLTLLMNDHERAPLSHIAPQLYMNINNENNWVPDDNIHQKNTRPDGYPRKTSSDGAYTTYKNEHNLSLSQDYNTRQKESKVDSPKTLNIIPQKYSSHQMKNNGLSDKNHTDLDIDEWI